MAMGGELIFSLLLLTPLYVPGAVGLLYITFVAIYTSHWEPLGWMGWNEIDEGWKIPLMYAIMLLSLVIQGAPSFFAFAKCRCQKHRLPSQTNETPTNSVGDNLPNNDQMGKE
jgi:uncharacterized membrane protein YphA (DoxX/SURF4 family)